MELTYTDNVNDSKIKLLKDNSKMIYHPYYYKCLLDKDSNVKIYNHGYKVISTQKEFETFFGKNKNYNEYINIINSLNSLYSENNLEFGGGIRGQCILKRLKPNVLTNNSKIFNALYEKLLPSIERNIFNTKIKVIDINAYKNCIHNVKEGHSSWLWHFDNHPNEMIKMMIYLTDVDEESSPFEILVDSNNDKPIRLNSNRIFEHDWKESEPFQYFSGQYNGNRISDNDIKNLLNNGYKTKKIYGKKGTIILFSENIIHKATYPKTKERNVVNTVLSSSIKSSHNINNSISNPNKYIWYIE